MWAERTVDDVADTSLDEALIDLTDETEDNDDTAVAISTGADQREYRVELIRKLEAIFPRLPSAKVVTERQRVMQNRVKYYIVALFNRYKLPQYNPSEVPKPFVFWFDIIVEMNFVEKFAEVCAACVLPGCLEEFGGNDWRRLRDIMEKIKKHPETTISSTSLRAIVYKLLWYISETDHELGHIGETLEEHNRIRYHLNTFHKAQSGISVSPEWYNIAAEKFKGDPSIAKFADVELIQDEIHSEVSLLVRRFIEISFGDLCNTFKEGDKSNANPHARGMVSSYRLLKDCLDEIQEILPPTHLRPTPIQSMTSFPFGASLYIRHWSDNEVEIILRHSRLFKLSNYSTLGEFITGTWLELEHWRLKQPDCHLVSPRTDESLLSYYHKDLVVPALRLFDDLNERTIVVDEARRLVAPATAAEIAEDSDTNRTTPYLRKQLLAVQLARNVLPQTPDTFDAVRVIHHVWEVEARKRMKSCGRPD